SQRPLAAPLRSCPAGSAFAVTAAAARPAGRTGRLRRLPDQPGGRAARHRATVVRTARHPVRSCVRPYRPDGQRPLSQTQRETMNEQRRQILQMLAEGKVTADEADRLIDALEREQPPSPPGAAPRAKTRPKYLRVMVNSEDDSGGNSPSRVNVR